MSAVYEFNTADPAPVIAEKFAPAGMKKLPVQHVNAPLPEIAQGAIIDIFQSELTGINLDHCDAHGENAFFVCDLAGVYKQVLRWRRELPRIEPFFAVKCNPDPYILRLFAAMGLGFDCASQPEINSVLINSVSPERIIYANPCKAPSFIRHAARNGVQMMTFDNGDELHKVKRYHPNAKMVLRILTDDSSSVCRLGLKFGAPLADVRSLIRKAKSLNIELIGISFHVGSGCTDPSLFADAIRRAKWAFDVAAEEGLQFEFLDIGGGFEEHNFEEISGILREAIDEHFPLNEKGEGVRIISEPGRYFVSSSFQLATNIIARRAAKEDSMTSDSGIDVTPDNTISDEQPVVMYYINDGVYGAFNCTMFDHRVVHPHVLTIDGEFVESNEKVSADALEPCSVWGPTCDSIDCVQAQAKLPVSLLEVGDWLRWEEMGAYTVCAASQFNGFRQSEVYYTIDAQGDTAIDSIIRGLVEA